MDNRDPVVSWLAKNEGVGHTSSLRAAGVSKSAVARAVSSGEVRRVRRSWLALAGADPRLAAAAAIGGRVTCVSRAEMLGLWVPVSATLHLAVRSTASRFDRGQSLIHWGQGPAPVESTASADHILNVLFHVASCLPRIDALAVWESAIRHRKVDPAVLERVNWGSPAARTLATTAGALSDSGLETIFVDGMRALGVAVRQQALIDRHRVDGLIGERLIVQIDGFAHHQGSDRRRDITSDARLTLRGYTVLRFDYHQLLFQWNTVADLVIAAIAQGRHLR